MRNIKFAMMVLVLGAATRASRAFANDTTNQGIKKLLSVICDIFDWIYTFALIVGVIMVIIAAFHYITSNGNTEKVDTATKTILYAVIGITIAILARGVPLIIGSVLKVPDASLEVCK